MTSSANRILQHVVSIVLVLAVVALLGYLSNRYKVEADWTAGNRNTLSDASVRLLESLKGPIKFTAFVYPEPELRREIEERVSRYQRFKPDIALEFVDPAKNPQRVREQNISASGEVVVEYDGRRENLRAISEQTVSAALQRLAYSGESWILFLEGHGERALQGTETSAYSQFAQTLRDKGLKVKNLNLGTEHGVPDNASALVIAGPTRPLLDGEVKLLEAYVDKGGSLLWLTDPDVPVQPAALAAKLGVAWQEGTAVLLETAALGLPPFVFITGNYPPNPITRGLYDNTLFPLVRGVKTLPDAKDWRPQPFLQSSEESWLELGALEGEIGMDPGAGEEQGPITVGLALTRDIKEGAGESAKTKLQRVALIGDADFLSNGYLDQLGNQQLGINVVQWLASREAQISVEVAKAPDVSLDLPPWAVILIALGYTFVLPALLVAFGTTRWMLRRRR
jgi:ABC-type uncharacterized transport system involved in gliding motility auxiliary subunit